MRNRILLFSLDEGCIVYEGNKIVTLDKVPLLWEGPTHTHTHLKKNQLKKSK